MSMSLCSRLESRWCSAPELLGEKAASESCMWSESRFSGVCCGFGSGECRSTVLPLASLSPPESAIETSDAFRARNRET